MCEKYTYIYRRKYSGNVLDVFYAHGYVFYSYDDYRTKQNVADNSYCKVHNSAAVELLATNDPSYQQSISHGQELVAIYRRTKSIESNSDMRWKSGFQFMNIGGTKRGFSSYCEYGTAHEIQHAVNSVKEVISLSAFVMDRKPMTISENEVSTKQTEYEALREAAMAAQCAIANILANGGTNINEWFEDIAEAQRRLAAQTNISQKEAARIREKYNLKFPF